MFKDIALVCIGVFLLLIDQLVKFFLIHSLRPNESIPVIKGVFHITLVFNSGCAFGLFRNQPSIFFLLISSVCVVFLVYFFKRLEDNLFGKLAAILLISGAATNLIDRLRFGYVVDFLDFRVWPVFNLGDTAITIGTIMFIVNFFFRPQT